MSILLWGYFWSFCVSTTATSVPFWVVYPFHFCEHNISFKPSCKFKFGSSIHLASKMNLCWCLDVKCQVHCYLTSVTTSVINVVSQLLRTWWSEVKITSHLFCSYEHNIAGMLCGNFLKTGTKIHLEKLIRFWWSKVKVSVSLQGHTGVRPQGCNSSFFSYLYSMSTVNGHKVCSKHGFVRCSAR